MLRLPVHGAFLRALTVVLGCLLSLGFAGPALADDACVAPGTLVVTDATGDQIGGPASNSNLDITSVSFAEPNWADGVRRLTVTMKVANLSTLPASASWRVRFNHGTPAVTYYVAMNMTADSSTPTFDYGVVTTTTEPRGSAESYSTYNADGTITIVINNSKVGDPEAGTVLKAVNALTSQFVGVPGTGGNVTIDSTPAAGPDYTMVAADACPIVDEDGDGVIDGNDFCPNTPAGTEVKENGCPVVSDDSDGDGISDEDDACPLTPPDTAVDAAGCPVGLPEIPLFFHGNAHDGCTGNGAADVLACGGPFLLPSALDSAAAAVFDDNRSLVNPSGTGPNDPNWTFQPDTATTIDGPIVVQAWASCDAECVTSGGQWTIGLFKNETLIAEFATLQATPEQPEVPSLLTFNVTPEDPIALNGSTDTLTLVLSSSFIDSGAGGRIYYDSTQACAPGGTGPCDSKVVFNAKDTDHDGVADVVDQCQGTPANTPVDGNGCPLAAATCTAGSEAAARSLVPASGKIKIDAPVLADWRQLAGNATYGAFVQFFNRGTREQQDALLNSFGLVKLRDFRRYTTSVYVEGPVAAFQQLTTHPWIKRIEHNKQLRYLDATQSWATRTRVAQETVSGGPYYDANGDVLTGKGVTLGIIDSGMFGAHPDFGGLTRISHNYKLVSPLGGPVYYQDVGIGDSENGGGGHGTHVSGIVAGGGQQSNGGYPDSTVAPFIPGTFTSASPDSKIIHWGNGAVLFVLSVDLAYQHLLDNIGLPEFSTLAAVNNSYGDGAGVAYNADDTDKQLIRQIVACGVNMVFAAGNDGGDGSADMTSSTCKDPTPGVICVASYNDQGIGTINGPLSAFSSRGKQGKPGEYPDIAAPGDLSTSTCAQATPTQAICTGGDDSQAETEWQPWYGTISGTSMASPNIVTIIGVIKQANPSLTPAEIESLLQRTARKVGGGYEDDPQKGSNPADASNTTHFGYGAGLVDTKAVLDYMGITRAGLPPAGEPWTIFVQDADPAIAGAADVVGLVMQEYDEGGVQGIEYRLDVRDIAAFGAQSTVAYRIEQNVNGHHYETTVDATADGLTIPEPGAGNTAPAANAGRIGNTVVVRIAYTTLGYPPLEAPIHNIAVFSTDGSNTLDFAPSPSNSTGGQAALQPMYGRPFTVRLAVSLPVDTESVCVVPGKTRLTDDPGDQVQTPPGFEEQYDILSVQVAEPGEGPLADKIVFTFKTRGFDGGVVPSGTRWVLRFNGPNPPPEGQDDFFIMMTTEEGAEPTFVYGTTGVTGDPTGTAGARTFQIEGDLEAESQFFEDGRIQLVLSRDNPLIGPLEPGDTLTHIFPTVRAPATPNNNGIYDQGGEFEHTLIDPASCLFGLPIAALHANPAGGVAPVTVTFDGSASSVTEAGAGIVSYTFDFGDGNDPLTQTSPTIQHTYMLAGTYTATLTVLDSNGMVSNNLAQVVIDVVLANLPPVANAGADFQVGEGTGVLLAGTASDANGDTLTYQWTQVSGPTVALGSADTASASFTAPSVTSDSDLVFRLTVSDGRGGVDTDDVVVRTLQIDPKRLGNNSAGGLAPFSLLVLGLFGSIRRKRQQAA
jgi:serine protease AprX